MNGLESRSWGYAPMYGKNAIAGLNHSSIAIVKHKRGTFMELREYIEEGAAKAGSVSALARMFGMNQPDLSNAKSHKRPLPAKAVVQLAEYIGADLKSVIAANELVTEKDEAKRAFWSPFVQGAKAASIALALIAVTSFVTPSPAEAAPAKETGLCQFALCKLIALSKKAGSIEILILGGFKSGKCMTVIPSSASDSRSSAVASPRMARPGTSL